MTTPCLWCNSPRVVGAARVNEEMLYFCPAHRADHEAFVFALGAWRAKRKGRVADSFTAGLIESVFGRRRRFDFKDAE
jgi:hypothetical protein